MNNTLPSNPTQSTTTAYEPVSSRSYRCRCGRPVFFRNSVCLACQTPLGYEPTQARVIPLDPGQEANVFAPANAPPGQAEQYVRCANFASAAECNWLISQSQAANGVTLCQACRLNRTIPDLSNPENQELWRRIETAKRRLVSQLIALKLPVASKVGEDPERGLAYDFLRSHPTEPRVLTGHDCGLITINLEEADDPTRERTRKSMGEPYRTLLGHFRHEVGHYYWDRLVDHTNWLEPYRALFGDERQDYDEAVKAHYQNGAPLDWGVHFVSAYASTHPWEDWAETWAHYLHMVDTADTAASFGIDLTQIGLETEPFGTDVLWKQDMGEEGQAFLPLVNDWVGLTAVMNEMSRSMGQPDFYPFVLSREVVTKLHFIHCVIHGATQNTSL